MIIILNTLRNGHHKAIHISVTNKDISQADNDVLYIYFNYPELTEEK